MTLPQSERDRLKAVCTLAASTRPPRERNCAKIELYQAVPALLAALDEAEAESAALREQVAELTRALADATSELQGLAQAKDSDYARPDTTIIEDCEHVLAAIALIPTADPSNGQCVDCGNSMHVKCPTCEPTPERVNVTLLGQSVLHPAPVDRVELRCDKCQQPHPYGVTPDENGLCYYSDCTGQYRRKP